MNNFKVLKEKVAAAPNAAGVYLMKDASGAVLYVGKAKSLKKRLTSYLSRGLAAKTIALMGKVRDIECRTCANESLALLLEAGLIHKHKPKYNVSLRDDKSFPYVKITPEAFPAVYITRKKEDDGAKYLGPYTSAKLLKEALKIIRHSFPYRSCRVLPRKACIYYRLHLSPAPCIGAVNRQEYAKTINSITLILEGKADSLMQRLAKDMELKAKNLDFEAAGKLRDQLSALSSLGQAKEGLNSIDELRDLQGLLHLPKLPERIEAFDISNLSGEQAVGSLVTFLKSRPDKNNYRRFRIKTVAGINDYAMLSEVIKRRYARLVREKSPLPDLILIDGGRAHLLTAARELANLGLDIPLASIAKEEEHIYTGESPAPLKLTADTPALNLFRRIRDEAHRFAVSYHHILRRKKTIGR
ncbi:MAG: excinuclease ABC subunit UvrC [Candidatus Omnitrophica bacterium]|nr:excinuclease ABC subunit UvrC [Candidatus Omnitrophota bacterium]